MSDLKTFLKVLEKYNYPNSSVDVPTLAKLSSYNIDNFSDDLEHTIGNEKTFDFIRNTFYKLGLTHDSGLKINLGGYAGELGSYIYLIINDIDIINDSGFDEGNIWTDYSFGDNLLIFDGESKTLDDIYEDVGLGELGEWDELLDEINDACVDEIYKKTGFFILMGDQD